MSDNAAALAAAKAAGTITPAPAQPIAPTVVAMPPADGGYNPNLRSPSPFGFSDDAANSKLFYNSVSPQQRISPPNPATGPSAGATAVTNIIQQQAQTGLVIQVNGVNTPLQTLENFIADDGITITADTSGGIHIKSNSQILLVWKDDFLYGNTTVGLNGGSSFGELRWDAIQGTGATLDKLMGVPPHYGQIQFSSGTTSGSCTSAFLPFGASVSGFEGNFQSAMALLDNPSWTMTWEFGFPSNRVPSTASPFPLVKTQFYIGLATAAGNTIWAPNSNNGRPAFFVGLRFDSDPGVTLALSSVATASGGKTIYSGTITGGASNGFRGVTFTIAGMGAGNNGTFYCTDSSNTTLTLLNASGSAATAAGTATSPSIGDTTFKFETVSNLNTTINRNNLQGTVVDTGIVPQELGYYTLTMTCTAVGVVTLTLTAPSGSASTTFSPVLTTSCHSTGGSGGLSLGLARQNNLGQVTESAAYINGTVPTSNMAWAQGSFITITNATNGFYNSVFQINGQPGNNTNYTWILAGASNTEAGTPATITGYPGVQPYFSWGNDTESSPASKAVVLDAYSLVITPA